MDIILVEILNALRLDVFISSKDIATEIGKSDKTVRKKMKDLHEELCQNGAHIDMKKGHGFALKVDDLNLYERFVRSLETTNTSHDKNIMRRLIQLLMSSEDYLKAEDLSEKLFISKSTLTKYLNEVRVYLRQYDLEIQTKPYYGLKVIGTEFNVRRFIASNFAQNYSLESNDVLDEETANFSEYREINKAVSSIVIEAVSTQEIVMSDTVIQSVIVHISIAILRIRSCDFIDETSSLIVSNSDDAHSKLVHVIMNEITTQLGVVFPEQEKAYVLMHFLSKKVINEDQVDNIPHGINELVDSILFQIYEKRKVDLFNDFDLRTMLGLHIVPLLYRLQFGTYLKNPILDDVKVACIAGFDLAIIASDVIQDYSGKKLHDHEISYLAMHFDVSLNRSKESIYLKNILVVCSTGRASGQLLKQKFVSNFSQYIKQIDVCDIHEIDLYESRLYYDYIFTTVPLANATIAPVFEFEFFLNRESVRAIETILTRKIGAMHVMDVFQESLFFVNEDHGDKETILNSLITDIMHQKHLSEDFRELVWTRENFSSTDILPQIAIPHPNQLVSDESFVGCMVLDKPINWGNHDISIIFLPCLSKKDSEKYAFIYDWIIKLSESREMMLNIQTKKTYKSLVESLLELTQVKETMV